MFVRERALCRRLLRHRDFLFILPQIEQAFFQRWWDELDTRTADLVRQVVARGQLEFINGGWSMHDEVRGRGRACGRFLASIEAPSCWTLPSLPPSIPPKAAPGFVDMIDQTSLGHRLLKQEFNVTPRTTWQMCVLVQRVLLFGRLCMGGVCMGGFAHAPHPYAVTPLDTLVRRER